MGKKRNQIIAGICLVAALFFSAKFVGIVSAAACPAPSADYGSVTATVNVPVTGSYKAWARVKSSTVDANANSFMLEIDGNTCIVMGDNTSLSSTSWTWIDYRDGATGTKATHTFSTTGAHTIKMIGREQGVKLDRVIMSADAGCTPTGTGDNCATPPDATPPSVSLTAPTDNSTVSGQVNLAATASDSDSGIQKVEFRIDGQAIGEDAGAPFALTWDSSTVTNGTHSITARAYNTYGLTTTSSGITVTVNNAAPPDTTPPTVSITAPTNNATVSNTISVTANASDNVGVTKVEFYADGNLIGSPDSISPYAASLDTKTLPNGTHVLTAKAFDQAGNQTTSTAVNVSVSNQTFLAEDINQDGHVNLLDFSLLASKYGQTGSNLGRADINADGRVNLLDFSLLASRYGT